jgi:FkbM family methyltransferase
MTGAARRALREAVHASMHVAPLRRGARRLGNAGLLPRTIWNRLPIVDDVFTVTLPDGATFRYRAWPGDAIGHAFYWTGVSAWEAETIGVFLALARRASRFLDIGANTGAYSLLACTVNPEARAVAYEPVPRVYERLAANIACNDLEQRIKARQAALSDHAGVAELHVPRSLVPSSASLDQRGFRNIAGELIEVEVTTADHDCTAESKVDLVKIDVEGFEDRVLAGMTRILGHDRPVIVCECNPDGPYRAVEATLAAHEYVFFHLRAPAPVAARHIAPDPAERFRNFACVPAEDRATRALLAGLVR